MDEQKIQWGKMHKTSLKLKGCYCSCFGDKGLK